MNFVWQSESVKLPSMYRIQSKFWSWLPEPGRPFDHECFDQKVQVIKHSRTIQKYSKSFGRVPNFFRCSKMFRQLWKWIIYLIRNYYLVFYMNLLINNRLKWLNCKFFSRRICLAVNLEILNEFENSNWNHHWKIWRIKLE